VALDQRSTINKYPGSRARQECPKRRETGESTTMMTIILLNLNATLQFLDQLVKRYSGEEQKKHSDGKIRAFIPSLASPPAKRSGEES